MANILDTLGLDWDRLQEFTDDLEGTLCLIAYAGYDTDENFKDQRKKELAKEYAKEIELLHGAPIFAFEMIEKAWDDFGEGTDAEEANNIIQECLIFDLPIQFSQDYLEPFNYGGSAR